MNKSIFLVFASLLLLTLVSAEGLVVSDNTYDFDKTYGVDRLIEITLENTEDFQFYDIHSGDESNLVFSEFDLDANTNITFNATVISDLDFNGIIEITGEYFTEIGSSNITYEVELNYDTGATPCDLEIIKGDSVNWTNLDSSKIFRITNYDTTDLIYELTAGNSHLIPFDSPQELRYQVKWLGTPFTPVCSINVLDDTGLVHSNKYDASLDLNIEVNYEDTSLEATFLQTSYEIEFNTNEDDIFSIRNTGVNIAKAIHLESDWISFTKNDFDLAPGQSTNVGYTISPLVMTTDETNITLIKNLTIEGNFGTLTQEIEVFIPYKRISTDFYNGTFDIETITSFFELFCSVYPDEDICERTQIIIGNGSGNFNITAESWMEFLDIYALDRSAEQNYRNAQQESNDVFDNRLSNLDSTMINLSSGVLETNENSLSILDSNGFILFIVLFFMVVGGGFFVWFRFGKKEKNINELEGYRDEVMT